MTAPAVPVESGFTYTCRPFHPFLGIEIATSRVTIQECTIVSVYVTDTGTGVIFEIPGENLKATPEGADLLRVEDGAGATLGFVKLEPGMIVTFGDEPPVLIGEPNEDDEAETDITVQRYR